jgi:HEAT repeats
MGFLKNDGRRSVDPAAKKRSKPSGQAAKTIIPEPGGVAPKNVLEALSAGTGGRHGDGRDADFADGAATTHIAAQEPAAAGREAASSPEPELTPAQREAAVRLREAAVFSLHLDVEPSLATPVAPSLEPPDLDVERARMERELGIPELAASLAQYGSPPVAPSGKPADRETLERELLRASGPVSKWNRGERRALRDQAREEASRQAQTEDQRRAADHEKLQHELDSRWAELTSLRSRAAEQLDRWVEEETRRRDADQAQRQAVLERGWRRQRDADPDSLTASLRAAFPEETVTVIGVLDGVAVLVVACPRLDEVIAPMEPAFTSAGRPTLRARTETRRNDLYRAALASHVLAAVGRALSLTPGITAVSCVAVRMAERGALQSEPIYVGTFDRAYAERLVADGRWSPDPQALASAVEEAEDVDLEMTAKTHRMDPLDVSADPGLAAVIGQLDAAIRSDDTDVRRTDAQALRAFLSYDADAEHALSHDVPGEHETDERESAEDAAQNTDNDTLGGEVADLRTEADMREPDPEEADFAEEHLVSNGSQDGAARRQIDLPARPGDPLAEALRDSDGFVRRAAIEAIGRRNDPDDTPLLLDALSDRDDYVRLEAMYALKDRLSPDMRRDALVRACSDDDEGVRRKAIDALAEMGDERDLPLLLEALQDPDDNVRLEAIYAVKQRLSADMRDALVTACGDADERVRRKAFEALAELGDERDTPLLLKGLKDSDSSVRLEVIYALEGRTKLGSYGGLSEHLSAAMKDDDASVRHAAVRLFGRVEQPTPTVPSS